MNRETDGVFLQTLGRFITAQIQLAVTPLMQTINDQANTIAQLSADKNLMIKELDGAIEGFAAEIARVEALMNDLPKAKDGIDGKDGIAGEPGANGKDGLNGADGKDGAAGPSGADVVAAFRDSDGHLVLTLSNGITKDIGQIQGKDGKDGAKGESGKDGLGIKELSVEFDGERTFSFKHVCENGEVKIESFRIPSTIFRGIWKEGSYQRGDHITKGGSSFIALRDTEAMPETKDSGWQLFAKRGMDGKDGKEGPTGKDGKPGRDGRDLTQLGPDGSKW